MHATLSTSEIRCDRCLAQLPPRLGENAVLARIRAAENGWTTVSYGRTRIVIARGRNRVCAPRSGEFCPACEPLSTEAWVKLCQQRLLACEPPFENRHRYDGNFRLIEYRAPASTSTPQADIGQLTVKEANKLATRGTCTWTCLLAIEEICTCRCGGPYHGAAVEALRDLRATIAAPAA